MRLFLLAVCLAIIAGSGSQSHGPARQTNLLRIPAGQPITIDGTISGSEWKDAATAEIFVSSDWTARVHLKHDAQYLYFAFEKLAVGEQRLFPEILLDPQDRKSEMLERGQWWLHISNNLCEGNGEVNVYTKNGVFQCAHEKSGWAAKNPPTQGMQVVEVRVSFEKLGIEPRKGMPIGMALDLTNATGDEKQEWFFWPASAKLKSPKTWAETILE
jgi:hypothetical protein